MYTTSAAYKQAIKSGYIRSRVEIVITPKSGEPFTVTDANILPDSLSVNNRATSSGQFGYGTVYVGSMNVTLIDVNSSIDRYSLFDAKCDVTFVQIISDNQEERIPLGTFYVNTPNRKKKTLSLSCYDVMTKFDVPLTEATFGTPYELLSYLCTKCGVVLAQTEEEIEALPNGDVQFTFARYQNMTARDALSNIAKVLCGFATIDRSGKLKIGQFSNTYNGEIQAKSRISSTIADYKTYFVAVTAGMYIDGEKKTISALTGRESGLILSLGDILIAQGTEPVMRSVLQTIADELADIDYTPCSCEIVSDPSWDLGDMILLSGVNNTSDNVSSLLTAFDWKYHSKMKLTGDGKNALLDAVKSSEAKAISEVISTITENAYGIKTYTNTRLFGITDRDTLIITLQYSANKETTAVLLATIPIEMSLDGYVEFTTYKEFDVIGSYKHYLPRGKSIVTISNYVQSSTDEQINLRVMMKCVYFESDKRQNDARIDGLIQAVTSGTYEPAEIDETIPTATIDVLAIRASVFANGMNTTVRWDGNIEVEDFLGKITIPAQQITVRNISDIPAVLTTQNNTRPTVTELISAIGIGEVNIGVSQIAEELVIGRMVLYYTINTGRAGQYSYNHGYVNIANDEFSLNESYPFLSHADTIDSGALKVCDVVTSTMDFASLEGLGVVASGEETGGGGGGSSHTRLPSEYQEVEYIESSGTQRIYTGYTVTNLTRIVADMQEVTANNYPRIFANGNLTGVGNVVMEYENGVLFVKVGSNSTYRNTGIQRDLGRHTYEIDKNIAKYDGTQVDSGNTSSFTGGALCIFGLRSASGIDYFKGKLYAFQIYENDVLVRDYVPCKRKSDSVVGVYDIIGNSFLANDGSGTFTAGANVGLPDTYQEVEYIESTGTQYIDTGVNGNACYEFDMSFAPMSYSGTSWNSILSGYLDNATLGYNYTTEGFYLRHRGIEICNRQSILSVGSFHSYEMKNNAFTIDGVQYGTPNTANAWASSSGNIRMFNNSAGSRCAIGKVKTLRLYGQSKQLLFDAIPCYRKSDGVIGLYDVVSNTFLTNAGTGVFSKGADVSPDKTYKTLITDGTDLYSISGGSLTSSIGLLTNLSAALFQSDGFSNLADCMDAEDDILALDDFSILRWTNDSDDVSTMVATVSAIPNEQNIITPAYSLTDFGVSGIELVTTDTDGSPQVSIKFDNGNWEYYDIIDEDWYEVGQGSRGYMTVADLEDLTEQIWADKLDGVDMMQTRFTLLTRNDTVTEIQYKFLNE